MNRRYNRLFVSNVSQSANIDELKELFEKVGKLAHFEISNGQGYIEFEDSKTAQEAVKQYDDHKFEGKRLVVENAVKNNFKYQKTYRSDQRDNFKKFKDEGRCFKCHERGHRAFDCKENSREKMRAEKKRYRSRSRNQSSSRSNRNRRSRSD